MQLFRVYMLTGSGRRSYECSALSPNDAGAKAKAAHDGALIQKIKAIANFTVPVPSDMTQEVLTTGRMSTSMPNVQQIPIRTPEGKAIRDAAAKWLHVDSSGGDFTVIERRMADSLPQDT